MKTPLIKIFALTALLAVVAFGSSGCISASLLSTGKTERKVFGGSTPAGREHVERYIGAPILTKQLAALPSMDDFDILWSQLNEYIPWVPKGSLSVYSKNLADIQKRSQKSQESTKPFLYARYNYKGQFISSQLINNYVGASVWFYGMTEPLLLPSAIWIRATGHNHLNYISVWYDENGRVVAYAWARREFSDPSSDGWQKQNNSKIPQKSP